MLVLLLMPLPLLVVWWVCCLAHFTRPLADQYQDKHWVLRCNEHHRAVVH